MDIDAKEPMDYFFCSVSALKEKRLFLFDMDGTIYEEDKVFDGTRQLLEFIEKIGGQYVFITNNSSKSVEDYVEKINRLGIKADQNNFFTSSQATIMYLQDRYPGKKVYCQGTKSLVAELSKAGIITTTEAEDDIDVVLVGFDTEMTSGKLRSTCRLLQEKPDVAFIATNPDLRCPVSFGFIPDCGSICQLIENTTDRKPIYIGKPEPTMVDIVRKKYGYSPDQTVVIGDRLYTDIASGLNAGVDAICVLTGEATVKDIVNGKVKPTYTLHSVYDLWRALAYYHGFSQKR